LKTGLKKVPVGLARVRKELPPPPKVFKSKKTTTRKQLKDELRKELQESRKR
jgi:hypothetical protein